MMDQNSYWGDLLSAKSGGPYKSLRKAIWLYFFLLIFEGALRKWFLPFLATPLLLVRDPIVIWSIVKALRNNIFPKSVLVYITTTTTIISIFIATIFGHGNIAVALYGARPFLFHIPFLFIIAKVFTREDIVQLGKAVLWLLIPMTVLITMQFYSPQTAWVNKGIGGEESAGFGGALGYFRPPGTFSFTNGVSLFYGFASSFVFYFWFNKLNVKRTHLILATLSLIAAIPLSISRGLFFMILVVALFVILSAVRKPQFLFRTIAAIAGLGLLLIVLSNLEFFQIATQAFFNRFEVASEQEGGLQGTLGDRYVGGLLEAFNISYETPFWGHGIGLYTSVGSKLLSGSVIKGISEGEWGRLIAECGLLLGMILIFSRIILSVQMVVKSYERLSAGDVLPWFLLGYGLIQGPQSNWAQPTSLGFSIISLGLIMASLNGKYASGSVIERVQFKA